MPRRLGNRWASLPPLYKKRVWQGLGAYAVVMAALGSWTVWQHTPAAAAWNNAIPHVSSEISRVYLNNQLTDIASPTFSLTDVQSASEPGAILLVMTELGLAKDRDERAINDMPAPVVLAFSPYGKYAPTMAAAAKKDGHDVAALIPMEPSTYPKDDPGPLALLSRNTHPENQRLLTRIFAAVPQATAAVNFMGSRFLSEEQNADQVIKVLSEQKMSFIETPAAYQSAIKTTAAARQVPTFNVDVFIDNSATESDIRAQLAELERLSRLQGLAVGAMRPLPLTFALVTNWLPTIESRNLRLVTLSEAQKARREGAENVLTPVSATAPPAPLPPASTQEEPANATP